MTDQPERSGIAVLAVTRQGTLLGAEIAASLRSASTQPATVQEVSLHVSRRWSEVASADAHTFECRLAERVAELFPRVETLVFVLAVGAAVRIVAPMLGRKQDDPGVICIDDQGQFVIPLLGGHQANANCLAEMIADAIDATAVVTTASESEGFPNLDKLGEWAEWICESDPETLKRAAATLLAGERPAIYQIAHRQAVSDDLPPEWPRVESVEGLRGWHGPRIAVTDELIDPSIVADGGPLLVYRPPTLVLGIGCSTDAPPDEVEALARAALAEAGLPLGSVRLIATIDRREDHPAVLQIARRARAGRVGYPADVLATVTNAPTPSSEVERHVGTPGVCEPAAILGANGGALLVPKRKSLHATVAVARRDPAQAGLGTLWLVGIGPGPVDLMTPRALHALRIAHQVIGYRGYLEMLSEVVAERRSRPYELGQERERAAEAIRLARDGHSVALVSSGDIGIYGMAGLVYELLAEEGESPESTPLNVEVIPGVTAASAANALLGAPLMLDFAAISLSDLLVPWKTIRRRLVAAAEGDLAVVLYNPASARRRQPFEEALAILRQHRAPETPVGLVREAYRPDQRVTVTTLGELPADDVDMRTVVVIGCSGTATLDGRMVTRRGYLAQRDTDGPALPGRAGNL